MSRRDRAFSKAAGQEMFGVQRTATTGAICPLDLEHILQYSKTGWCPGRWSEKSQPHNLLKDRSMNKTNKTKLGISPQNL